MKLRLPGLTFVIGITFVFVSVVACGDGQVTLEEYLQRLDILEADSEAALDRAAEDFDEAVEGAETGEQVVDAFREFLRATISIGQENSDDVASLDPPPEVEDLHEAVVAAQADGLELLVDLNRRAQVAESISDVENLNEEFLGPDFSAIVDRAQEAFCAIQTIADDNGIDVDVGCEQ